MESKAAKEAAIKVADIAVLAASQWTQQNRVSSEIHRQYTSWM
jgi:hypothetical protein